MSLRNKGLLVAMGVGASLFAGAAQAASVDSLISNGSNVLSDDNRQRLINNVGAADVIDVGDALRGVITFNQLFNPGVGPSGALLGGSSGNQELTGLFEIVVTSKTLISPGGAGVPPTYSFTFGPSASFGADGTMVRFYTGAPNIQLDLTTLATSEATASDGSLFWELGYTGAGGAADAGEGWAANGPDTLAALNAGSGVGFSNFAISRTSTAGVGGDYALTEMTGFFGTGAEIVGTALTRGTTGLPSTPWQLAGDTTVQFNVGNVIPLPAAAWSGLTMLGALGGMYARRRARA